MMYLSVYQVHCQILTPKNLKNCRYQRHCYLAHNYKELFLLLHCHHRALCWDSSTVTWALCWGSITFRRDIYFWFIRPVAVWFRHHFNLPASLPNHKLHLHFYSWIINPKISPAHTGSVSKVWFLTAHNSHKKCSYGVKKISEVLETQIQKMREKKNYYFFRGAYSLKGLT